MSVLINLHGSSKSMTNSFYLAQSLDVSKIDHLSGGKEREKLIGPHNTPFDLKYEASGKHCTESHAQTPLCGVVVVRTVFLCVVALRFLSPIITEQAPRVLHQAAGSLPPTVPQQPYLVAP